jgi:hypothetical protein
MEGLPENTNHFELIEDLQVNDYIDVLDSLNKWIVAKIIEISNIKK